MVVVEVLDKEAGKHKKTTLSLAKWLMKRLNKGDFYLEVYLVGNRFMNKNVLSFAAPKAFPRPDLKRQPLGEIYLNPDYIQEHDENLEYMLIHGFLHLLGYDHVKKSDRIAMEKKEWTILSAWTSGQAKSKQR